MEDISFSENSRKGTVYSNILQQKKNEKENGKLSKTQIGFFFRFYINGVNFSTVIGR